MKEYLRPEKSTYLSFSEWYIVFSSEEYTQFIAHHHPSAFPYFSSIRQFWFVYRQTLNLVKSEYGIRLSEYVLWLIMGISFSAEYALKGLYEHTIGRITEYASLGKKTAEDQFAYEVSREYTEFIYDYPWYEFPFIQKVGGLWKLPFFGIHFIRKWERRIILSLEYVAKALYGKITDIIISGMFGNITNEIYATVTKVPMHIFETEKRIKKVEEVESGKYIIALPRYRLFTDNVSILVAAGGEFVDIAGNSYLLITIIAPREWECKLPESTVLFTMKILTNPDMQRVAIKVSVQSLHRIIKELKQSRIKLEHLYEYQMI
ncbi:MAG: hypothetical protein KBD29_02195 [Candidatus Magasanikbacteria bacterium]|nr:hypothetical protein [Candidatus Magasanikbacteria bacterium]